MMSNNNSKPLPSIGGGAKPLTVRASTTDSSLPSRTSSRLNAATGGNNNKLPQPVLSPVNNKTSSSSVEQRAESSSSARPDVSPVQHDSRRSIFDPPYGTAYLAAMALKQQDAPPTTVSVRAIKDSIEAKTALQRMTSMARSAVQRRASVKPTSATARRTSVNPSILRKKSSVEVDEAEVKRRTQMISGQNDNSSQQLSKRLSLARGSAADQALAKPSPANRKKSENPFTKKEIRSIRLAATEARSINWEDDDRTTSDDTSISGGDDDNQRRPTAVLNVDTVYKPNESTRTSRTGSFECINPSQEQTHHFGMLIFSASTDAALLEEDEDD